MGTLNHTHPLTHLFSSSPRRPTKRDKNTAKHLKAERCNGNEQMVGMDPLDRVSFSARPWDDVTWSEDSQFSLFISSTACRHHNVCYMCVLDGERIAGQQQPDKSVSLSLSLLTWRHYRAQKSTCDVWTGFACWLGLVLHYRKKEEIGSEV